MAQQEEQHNCSWYVLSVLSGQEFQTEALLNERIQLSNLGNLIPEVLVPTEKVQDVKNGKKRIFTRRFYPGYLFVKMELTGETWQLIKKTSGVIGFLGGDSPKPLTEAEARDMFAQFEASKERIAPRILFKLGERVRITNGPFRGSDGLVEEFDEERGVLTVSVMVFGRANSVHLENWQVEKFEA